MIEDSDLRALSGIRKLDFLWSKLNFQDLGAIRNLNASISNNVAGLSTAAQNGFGGFGLIMPAEMAIMGSLLKDWGSCYYPKNLNLSDRELLKNIQEIQESQPIKTPAQLQYGIAQNKRQLREAIPISVEEVYEDFEPLLEELKKPTFNEENFREKCNKFFDKYKSKNPNFQTNVISPIKQEVDKILNKEDLTKELDKLFDVALRIKNKTDHYNRLYGVIKYNEVHLPPLLPLMEGVFIADDFDDKVDELEVYKTIQDVRKIIFQKEESHTEENFNALTPQQKKKF